MSQRTVTVECRGANHTLHIVLSVLTAGLWIPIWVIASMAGRKTKTVTRAPQPIALPQQPYQSSGYQQQGPYPPQQPQQAPFWPQPPQQQYPPQQQGWQPPQQ